MADSMLGFSKSHSSGNWIRLRTLLLLRWWAIGGQISALIIAQRLYNLNLEIGLCYLVVGVSVISNLIASFVYPTNKRLSERETLLVVLFDLLQLGATDHFPISLASSHCRPALAASRRQVA